MRDLWIWATILSRFDAVITLDQKDESYIMRNFECAWPARGHVPKPLHYLLRIPSLPRSVNVLHSFNVVLDSWQMIPTQYEHLIPYDRDEMFRSLQTLSWWNDFFFILTDSPPSSGTDDGEKDADEDPVDRFPVDGGS